MVLWIGCVNGDEISYTQWEENKETLLGFLKQQDHEGSSIHLNANNQASYYDEAVYKYLGATL